MLLSMCEVDEEYCGCDELLLLLVGEYSKLVDCDSSDNGGNGRVVDVDADIKPLLLIA